MPPQPGGNFQPGIRSLHQVSNRSAMARRSALLRQALHTAQTTAKEKQPARCVLAMLKELVKPVFLAICCFSLRRWLSGPSSDLCVLISRVGSLRGRRPRRLGVESTGAAGSSSASSSSSSQTLCASVGYAPGGLCTRGQRGPPDARSGGRSEARLETGAQFRRKLALPARVRAIPFARNAGTPGHTNAMLVAALPEAAHGPRQCAVGCGDLQNL